MLFDATKHISDETTKIIKRLQKYSAPCYAILNKIDLIDKKLLFEKAKEIDAFKLYQEIFMISALKNKGVQEMLDTMDKIALPSPWLFVEDQITDGSLKSFAQECTREQIMLLVHKEIPYQLKVETESWQEDDDNVRIYHNIIVSQAPHKKIILGKGGAKIRDIGTRTRKQLAPFFDKRVHLFLHVKVRPDWMKKLSADENLL